MWAKGVTTRVNITQKILFDTYDELTERANIDLDFLLRTIAAAVICSFGFKMNSAPVIVGAMVLSPLIYPVICAGAATYRADWGTLALALRTFAIGFLIAVTAAAIVSIFYATTFRSEISDRLSGEVLDYFFVALFSGLAGTYGVFSPKIHDTIAGIAISVALIPPIVMLGIGLGVGIVAQNTDIIFTSSKIVLWNICGIFLGSVVMIAILHIVVRKRGEF